MKNKELLFIVYSVLPGMLIIAFLIWTQKNVTSNGYRNESVINHSGSYYNFCSWTSSIFNIELTDKTIKMKTLHKGE